MKNKTDDQKGFILGVLASFAFATYALINRFVYINYSVDKFDYTATFLIAGGLFAAISLVFRELKSRTKLNKKFLPLVLNGIVAAIGLGTFVYGQGFTTASNASILATSSVITTTIFSLILLREKLNKTQIIWMTIMFIGFYLAIVGLKGYHFSKGDLIVVSSSVMLGFSNTFAKVLMKNFNSQLITDARLVGGGLFVLLVCAIFRGSDFLITSAGAWPLLAGLFFWLTIRCFYGAIHYINPNRTIVLANSHPIFTPVIGALLFGEHYTLNKFVGALLLIVSIYFINAKKTKVKP